MSIRIAIVDDHPMVLAGLQQLLMSFENITVTQTYRSAAELLQALPDEQPDVLLLDVLLPDKNGEEVAKTIKKNWPDVHLLAITSIDTPQTIKSMLKAGCQGYVLKNADRQLLIEAIETVYDGNQYIAPELKDTLVQEMLGTRKINTSKPVFTRREKEILQLISEEYTSQQIAEKLFLSLRTVENHRKSMLQKLDVKNMVGLIKKSLELGLIE